MKVTELLHGLPIRVLRAAEVTVTGVNIDSRRVTGGDLFVAVPGAKADGRSFAASAMARGAVVVLAAPGPVPDNLPPGIAWWEADEPRALAGVLAARVYGHPDQAMTTVAVTGTNGKSTVAIVTAALLSAAGRPAGVIGTIHYKFGDDEVPAERTTPEAPEAFALLRRWYDRGARAVAMEASSHALALNRLAGMSFDAAIFTNLTRDHLDFHKDLEDYFQAKCRLFELLKPTGRAVVGIDDGYGRRLAQQLSAPLTFGATGDVRAENVTLSTEGIRADLVTPVGRIPFQSRLLGRYNLENVLAAAAAGVAVGLPLEAIAAGLAERGPITGRLEPVHLGPGVPQPFPVYVDFAHTPEALRAVLQSVREFTGRSVIAVFGAGGDKDRGKRGPMGEVVGELAALPIITSDNPRSEDPLEIIRAVEAGVKASGNRLYRIVPDRREAIRRAIAVAGPGDVVVVAGKGHEATQESAGKKTPFSDHQEIRTALEERFGHPAAR